MIGLYCCGTLPNTRVDCLFSKGGISCVEIARIKSGLVGQSWLSSRKRRALPGKPADRILHGLCIQEASIWFLSCTRRGWAGEGEGRCMEGVLLTHVWCTAAKLSRTLTTSSRNWWLKTIVILQFYTPSSWLLPNVTRVIHCGSYMYDSQAYDWYPVVSFIYEHGLELITPTECDVSFSKSNSIVIVIFTRCSATHIPAALYAIMKEQHSGIVCAC